MNKIERIAKRICSKGYDWNNGMSNNATDAYNRGLIPLSKITQSELNKYGIELTVKQFKRAVGLGLIDDAEWHHTSKFFNKTKFYDLENIWDYCSYDNAEDLLEEIEPTKFIKIDNRLWKFELNGKSVKGLCGKDNKALIDGKIYNYNTGYKKIKGVALRICPVEK